MDGDTSGLALLEGTEDPVVPRLVRGTMTEGCEEFGPSSAAAKISAEATTRRSEDV